MQSRIQLRLPWITLPHGSVPTVTYPRIFIDLLSIVLEIVTQSSNSMCLFPAFNFATQLSLLNERDKAENTFLCFY